MQTRTVQDLHGPWGPQSFFWSRSAQATYRLPLHCPSLAIKQKQRKKFQEAKDDLCYLVSSIGLGRVGCVDPPFALPRTIIVIKLSFVEHLVCARHWIKFNLYILSLDLYNKSKLYAIGSVIVCISQMKKLGLREVNWLAQGHLGHWSLLSLNDKVRIWIQVST